MKYAIPPVLILLVGISVCLHRGPARPIDPVQRSLLRQVVAQDGAETPVPKRTPTISLPDEMKPTVVSSTKPASVAPWRVLLGTVDRTLALKSFQQTGVEQILLERDNEIKACHEAIRKSGFLDIRHYEWQVGLMKESWYRRIDALLDGVQHERFVVLVEQGLFNEGLAFTVEPEMTVLE